MKYLSVLLVILLFISCKNEPKKEAVDLEEQQTEIAPLADEVLETAIIYEANIRQYSPEGTFDEFTKDIPQLKQLGVKVIWLMPIYPISEVKRKATNGQFADDIEDLEEREKILGSYYAVSDFTEVNPEFGSKDDFRRLLQVAHDNDIYVILDWVPNHTGWGHVWIDEHPEFYTQNENGEIIDPVNPETGESWGWDDVADLNYDNKDMRKAMIADMLYWVTEENVDGFRCDVASNVPTDFWEQAIPQLRNKKKLFMLAEAWQPELLKDNLFDMAYAWGGHHLMNDMASGEKNATAWSTYMKERQEQYEADDILMNFVTNHDENSWNGTVNERLSQNAEAMTALSFTTPGMPLIYSGMEYDMDHRLKFFEKDSIPKEKGEMWPLLEKLATLKQNNKALNGGKTPAEYTILKTSKENAIIAFKRSKENDELIYLANLSNKPVEFTLETEGDYINTMTNKAVSLKKDQLNKLEGNQYLILVNQHRNDTVQKTL